MKADMEAKSLNSKRFFWVIYGFFLGYLFTKHPPLSYLKHPQTRDSAEFRNFYRETRYLLDASVICGIPFSVGGPPVAWDAPKRLQNIRKYAKRAGFEGDSVAVDFEIMVATELHKPQATAGEESLFRCKQLVAGATAYRESVSDALKKTEDFLRLHKGLI
jgi:hypothetical protein